MTPIKRGTAKRRLAIVLAVALLASNGLALVAATGLTPTWGVYLVGMVMGACLMRVWTLRPPWQDDAPATSPTPSHPTREVR